MCYEIPFSTLCAACLGETEKVTHISELLCELLFRWGEGERVGELAASCGCCCCCWQIEIMTLTSARHTHTKKAARLLHTFGHKIYSQGSICVCVYACVCASCNNMKSINRKHSFIASVADQRRQDTTRPNFLAVSLASPFFSFAMFLFTLFDFA